MSVNSEIKIVLRMCSISGVPVERSRYQRICRALGFDSIAEMSVYEVIVPCADTSDTSNNTGLPTNESERTAS